MHGSSGKGTRRHARKAEARPPGSSPPCAPAPARTLTRRQLKVASVMYSPQFLRRLSVAARRLYQGILDITWCGTCTLMSKHRNSTHCAGEAERAGVCVVRVWLGVMWRRGEAGRGERGYMQAPGIKGWAGLRGMACATHCCRPARHATAHPSPHLPTIEGTHPRVVAVHGARQLCLGRVPLAGGLEGDVRRGVVHHGEGACSGGRESSRGRQDRHRGSQRQGSGALMGVLVATCQTGSEPARPATCPRHGAGRRNSLIQKW